MEGPGTAEPAREDGQPGTGGNIDSPREQPHAACGEEVPSRAHPSRRHRGRRVRVADRSRTIPRRSPTWRRRTPTRRRRPRTSSRPAGDDLPGDQGAHPGDRPVGARPQGRLVVLHPHRGGQAVRHPVPAWRPDGETPPALSAGEPLARRGGAARRQRAGRGHDFFSLGTARRQPRRHAARLLDRLHRRRAVHAAVQGPRAPASCSPTRSRTSTTARAWSADGSTFFYTTVDDAWRPVPGLAAHPRHRRPTTTCSSTRRPTSGSGSASSLTRSEQYLVHRRSAARSPARCGILDADDPTGEFRVVIAPRRQGVEYGVEHAGDRFLILHNDGRRELRAGHRAAGHPRRLDAADRAPARTPGCSSVDAFADHVVVVTSAGTG